MTRPTRQEIKEDVRHHLDEHPEYTVIVRWLAKKFNMPLGHVRQELLNEVDEVVPE